jgi:hypothetical protein
VEGAEVSMRWKRPWPLVLRLASVAAAAHAVAQTAPAVDRRDDIAALRQFLGHDRSYSKDARAAAEAEIDRLGWSGEPLSAAAFQLAVARVAALARNGHTLVIPAFWPFHFNRIAVRFHLFSDGLFVIHAPGALGDLEGARVVSIDGHEVDELRQAFARYSGARESKRDEWLGFFLESPALLHAAGLARLDDRVALALELADGTRHTRVVPARLDPPAGSPMRLFFQSRLVSHAAENASPVPLSLAEPDRFFRRAPLPDLDAEYVQLRANASVEGEEVEEFLSRSLATVKERSPTNLVVDLRFDGGGDLNTTRAFFQALPSLVPREGRIFALTSGRTFSAGISSLGYLKQAGGARVTIVGEPIGDHLEFWAEGSLVELPASGARLLYATERHDYTTGCPEPDCHAPIRDHPIRVKSLEPDLLAPLTFADYRAGRDPALAAVGRLLGRP